MTAFRPYPPRKAIDLVEAAGIPHARRLIRDQAASGLVRSYAMKIETIDHDGKAQCRRGDTMPSELWQRIVAEGVDDDVWIGGTVRLAAADLIGGVPAVNITEIGFNEPDLRAMIDRQDGILPKAKATSKAALPATAEASSATDDSPPKRTRRKPDPSVIPEGALITSLKNAGIALGYGRTTIDKLSQDGGPLERVGNGPGVRITVASIKAFAVRSQGPDKSIWSADE